MEGDHNGDAKVRVVVRFEPRQCHWRRKYQAVAFHLYESTEYRHSDDDIRIAPARPQEIAVWKPFLHIAGTGRSGSLSFGQTESGDKRATPTVVNHRPSTTLIGDKETADFSQLFVYPDRWDAKYAELAWGNLTPDVSLDSDDLKNRTHRYEVSRRPGFHLNEGENTVWIACRLKDDANIDHQIGVQLRSELHHPKDNQARFQPIQRLGAASKWGDDGSARTHPGSGNDERRHDRRLVMYEDAGETARRY